MAKPLILELKKLIDNLFSKVVPARRNSGTSFNEKYWHRQRCKMGKYCREWQ